MLHVGVTSKPAARSGPISLIVWGSRACFNPPETAIERSSYPFITPTAARGLLRSIVLDPRVDWVVDRIEMLVKPRWFTETRNETRQVVRVDRASERSPAQRQTAYLLEPAYRIVAHFVLDGGERNPAVLRSHEDQAKRRIARGQMWRPAFLGTRECLAEIGADSVETIDYLSGCRRTMPVTFEAIGYDASFQVPISNTADMVYTFARCEIRDGVLDLSGVSA